MKTSVLILLFTGCRLLATPLEPASGADVVFQFRADVTFTNGGPRTTRPYLWIPPGCIKVRGVILMNQNLLEEVIASDPFVRQACADTDLAIVWCQPGFIGGRQESPAVNAAIVQKIMDALAAESGYDEIAKAPWLPIGHSATSPFVRQMVAFKPGHILGAIYNKGGPGITANREVPILCTAGEFLEWEQQKHELLAPWNRVDSYESVRKERAATDEPVSYFLEPGTGHFDSSPCLTRLIAQWIAAAARARCTDDSTRLRPVDLANGWVVGLPVPGAKPSPPVKLENARAEEKNNPWYFTRELAEEAANLATADWTRKPQIAAFATADGKPLPFGSRGIVWPIPFTAGDDGVTFHLASVFLDQVPVGFLHAGTPLGHGSGSSVIERVCGNVEALGEGNFRIRPGRTWDGWSWTCLIVRKDGDKNYRTSIQPGKLEPQPNRQGRPQRIAFAEIPDQVLGTKSVPLRASADSGLPVGFFVRNGPAYVAGGALKLTAIPPCSRFPVKITVVAYQLGRSNEPAWQTAFVERTFLITKP